MSASRVTLATLPPMWATLALSPPIIATLISHMRYTAKILREPCYANKIGAWGGIAQCNLCVFLGCKFALFPSFPTDGLATSPSTWTPGDIQQNSWAPTLHGGLVLQFCRVSSRFLLIALTFEWPYQCKRLVFLFKDTTSPSIKSWHAFGTPSLW